MADMNFTKKTQKSAINIIFLSEISEAKSIMTSWNRTRPGLVAITITKFGDDRTGNGAWNANGMQKSTAIQSATVVMTSS